MGISARPISEIIHPFFSPPNQFSIFFYIDFAFSNDFFSKLPFSVKFRRFLTKNPSYVEKSIISSPHKKNLRPLQSQRIKTYL